MKIQEIKHNHSLTELLKVLLFALIMLAPIASVATRCLYVVCNKNAYQSYSGYNIQTNTELATKIESGLDYQFSFNNYSGNVDMPNEVKVDNVYIASGYTSLSTFYAEHGSEIEYIRIYMPATSRRIYFYDGEMNTLNYFALSISQNNFISFTAKSNGTLNDNDLLYRVYQQQVGNSLDNVFDYSVSQLENDQLFSWTQQTAIYTGVHAMCTNLGITNTVVPQILVYWFLLSVIYVIIDIILKTFTTLTHMLGSKKA